MAALPASVVAADSGQRASPTLAGTRVTLRPFTEADISERYLGWLNDPAVNRFLEVRHARQTRETALAYVRSFYGDTEQYLWRIGLNETETAIGTASLSEINRHHGTAELGLMIGDTAWWGKGCAGEVIRLLAAFGFDVLGLRRLTAGTYAVNHRMNRTFKRLGFACEGRLQAHYVLEAGRTVDGFRWGLLAEEWRARRRDGR